MTDPSRDFAPPPPRHPTGVAGLDAIIQGGLFRGGIYIVAGAPGAGKTIFANQMAFADAQANRRTLYVTLLAETHGRMLAQLQALKFFDPRQVGTRIKYLNGFSTLESDGLGGLMSLLRSAIREHKAELLVLDGMVAVGLLARSDVDLKKFINELQTWMSTIGCTALFLTSSGAPGESGVQPEHTMVDGIIELRHERRGLGYSRLLTVTKFRGSAFTEGSHNYAIRDGGLRVFPRFEAHNQPHPVKKLLTGTVAFGVKSLDRLFHGGVSRRSTTLLLGSSGAGKTILGSHFLAEGARQGEAGLHFGFFESPADLCAKADRVGLPFSKHCDSGLVEVLWQKPAEQLMDELAYRMLDLIDAKQIRRVFVDGLVGFRQTAHPERISAFFSVLTEQLAIRDVTTVISEETTELFVREVVVPTEGVSAIFHNILFLRQAEVGGEIGRTLVVLKTRDTEHERGVFEFEISKKGVTVGKKVTDARGALTGDGSSDARRSRRR